MAADTNIMQKSIRVPYIADLETMSKNQFESAMNQSAASGCVDTVNWPDEFAYCPQCSFKIARSGAYLAVWFSVCGKDLRATEMEDNGRNWEDSCCEFFLAPCPEYYYNMEINCIGSVLMAKGSGRGDRVQVDPSRVASIIRHASLEHKLYDIQGGNHEWSVAILIPFELIDLDSENLPESLGCNFYKCGDLTATPHFVTWNPIPCAHPDFHRPEFFGKLEF